MRWHKLCCACLLLSVNVFAQKPSAYVYHTLTPSTDGTKLYGYSQIEGTMTGSFPPGAIRHTYTASFTITPPAGSKIQPVSCSSSQTGDPQSNFDVVCTSPPINYIGIGTYMQNLSDSGLCSYAGYFFSDSGTAIPNVGEYPNLNGIVTLVANANGSYTASMSQADFAILSADLQEYFQSECGCPDSAGIIQVYLNAIRNVNMLIQMTNAVIAQQVLSLSNKQSPEAHTTPPTGTPNSVKVFNKSKPGSSGKTVRVYGSDGRAVRDIDYGNQTHSGNDPEVHDWTWDSNGNPKRGPGRAPQPGDIPPGY
jgi:hypothetical protein